MLLEAGNISLDFLLKNWNLIQVKEKLSEFGKHEVIIALILFIFAPERTVSEQGPRIDRQRR